jgi:hypothetical protein
MMSRQNQITQLIEELERVNAEIAQLNERSAWLAHNKSHLRSDDLMAYAQLIMARDSIFLTLDFLQGRKEELP